MRRRPALLAVVALAGATLVGCTGEEAKAEPPPAERLAAVKTAFDAAKTVHLDLTSRDVPPRENGVTRAKGAGVIDAAEPKFQGTITGTIKGVAGTIDVIAIGEATYLKFFTPDYVETDFDTLNAPNPANFFDPGLGHLGAAPADGRPQGRRTDPVGHGGARQDQRHPAGLDGGGPVPPR